jgi:hypothetical protein
MNAVDPQALAERVVALENKLRELTDRQEILELAAQYQRACDGGWSQPTHADPDFLANLFTEDGRYQVGDAPMVTGRESIRARFVQLQALPWIIHYLANPLIEITGDTATAELKGFFRRIDHRGDQLLHGSYHGEFKRTEEAWRFQLWTFRNALTPPDPSLSAAATHT